jgi:exosortase
MLWHQRSAIIEAKAPRSAAGAFALLAFSLLLYLLGVRLKAGYIEFGALAPALAACLAMLGGWRLVPRFSYVLLFLVLATPMPAPVIFAATSGLKLWVSQVAEFVLHAAGYPVGRDGVTLRVGQYGLLMADACSGMNSLISLLATGFLYIYLTARRTVVHTALLIAAILPVAVATNIVRVIILMLITYHLGDEAGQGFLHEFAGFVMFLVAVLILAGLDIAFGRVLALGRRGAAGGSST